MVANFSSSVSTTQQWLNYHSGTPDIAYSISGTHEIWPRPLTTSQDKTYAPEVSIESVRLTPGLVIGCQVRTGAVRRKKRGKSGMTTGAARASAHTHRYAPAAPKSEFTCDTHQQFSTHHGLYPPWVGGAPQCKPAESEGSTASPASSIRRLGFDGEHGVAPSKV